MDIIYQERLLKLIKNPHISEKTSIKLEQNNVVVLSVRKYATKTDIKNAVCMFFAVKVNKVNTLITSRKSKKIKNKIGYRCSYKKAYIVLKKGYKIDFINKLK